MDTPAHDELRRSLGELIDRTINPHVREWEAAGQYPAHEVFRIFGRAGFLGLCKPREYGGQGLDYSFSAVMAETLGARVACGGIPMSFGIQTDMTTTALERYGSEELKQEFMVPSIRGDLVACLGVSEIGAGSDVASIKTRARRDGDDYVIDGGKMWQTNGVQADWMCLLANTGEGAPHRNKSLICLPLKTRGVQVARKLSKLGSYASDTAQIFFENVRVPVRNRIGEEGMGFIYQMQQFQPERLWAAARGVGQCTTVLARWAELAGISGDTADDQLQQFEFAELAADVEATRALLYRSVAKYVAGDDVTRLVSMLKLKAGRLMRMVPSACLRHAGESALAWDSYLSRMYRDMRLGSIGGGADEVMLTVIAKSMGMAVRA